jgi:hypothetical protein|tara:strand:+ start:66 stop:266 length:201 start_codon:yes stop_codon:yes gene_type:complete
MHFFLMKRKSFPGKIEEKRTVLPVLIMRQMSGRLADLRQFQGISKIGILTQVSCKIDVKGWNRDLF